MEVTFMRKKLLALLLITGQTQMMLEARGGGGHGGGGHGGGGHGGGRGGGGHGGAGRAGHGGGGHRSGGGGHHGNNHGGHGGYGHGGYGRGGYGGWGRGWGWAGGLWLGMALTMPLWWNSPSNSNQQQLKNQIEDLQQSTYDMQSQLDELQSSMKPAEIVTVTNKIESNKQKVQALVAEANKA